MTMGMRIAWVVVLTTSTVGLGAAWRTYASAHQRGITQVQRARQIVMHVRNIERIRPVAEQWQSRKRPEAGLAARLGETLTGCGISAAALANVTPQPETAIDAAGGGMAATGLKRQRASFALTPITLPQLGGFLELWRTREPFWTVASIDVAPMGAGQAPPGGGDIPLRAVITLDAVYLDNQTGERKEDRK